MSEVSYSPEDQEFTKLTDLEFLQGVGFSFVTPARSIKQPSPDRMTEFDRYDYRDPIQRSARIIDVAYYALELSTPLAPLEATMRTVEKDGIDEIRSSQELIDDYLIALNVDQILARAHNVAIGYEPTQLEELKGLTADYTHANTGSLAALRNMATPNKKRGYISAGVARQSENLLRLTIAIEKGIDLP